MSLKFVPDAGKTTEVLASELEHLTKALESVLNGRLSKRALIVLVKDKLPHGKKVSEKHIEAVLDALMNVGSYVVEPGTNYKRKIDI